MHLHFLHTTYCFLYALFIFFFKQKTAYEMRISDWSSDVCSSDLIDTALHDLVMRRAEVAARIGAAKNGGASPDKALQGKGGDEIGRASWRERVCQYV